MSNVRSPAPRSSRRRTGARLGVGEQRGTASRASPRRLCARLAGAVVVGVVGRVAAPAQSRTSVDFPVPDIPVIRTRI